LTRLYFPADIPAHGIVVLPAQSAHHLVHVLRVRAGDSVVVFDGRGSEYDASIDRVDRGGVTLRVGEARVVNRESPVEVTLAQGISTGERMDYTVQKAVELGVAAIQPLTTERSVVRLDEARAAKRVAHWQAVVAAACEQCGRNIVPPVLAVKTLSAWLGTPSGSVRLTLSPGAGTRLAGLEKPKASLTLLVGPEGGLSTRERADAEAAGYLAVRLGPRVLRTETAALAALAAMQTLWGDF
jgi:16S rRNA (uracil1498-N3)-methyltransferase